MERAQGLGSEDLELNQIVQQLSAQPRGLEGVGEEMLSWPRGASALPSPFGGWDSSPHGGFHEIFYTNHLFEDLNEYKFCSD